MGPSPARAYIRDTITESGHTDAGTGERLRLLSYNIQAGISTTHFHQYLTHSWKHVLPDAERLTNLDSIACLASNFDLVGLQEVDAGSLRSGFVNQTEYLALKAGFTHWHHQTNRTIGNVARQSIGLVSRFRPTLLTEHKLPGRIPGRGALRVEFGSPGAQLVLVIIHLALGRRARLQQLKFIGELITDDPNVIVMGDLNCRSRSPEMDQLLGDTGLCEPTHDLLTFPSWRPSRNIDHILVTPSVKVERVSVLNYPFSDHLPVAMDVLLPGNVTLRS
ncbi:MAG: endonuclease [Chromatiales bacterium 21-64-14]|nr:MAG: endonuclease [Chromatiales bacterium 21-64-14]